MQQTVKCLACRKPMKSKRPRAEDRSRENNLCPACYAAVATCGCGCGKEMPKYNSRGSHYKFVKPSHFWNVPEKRERVTALQSAAMKRAWKRAEYRDPKTGPNHHKWNGGVWPYPSEFNKNLKKAIKQRDDFACQNPNCPHENRLLHVHHLDGDKANNDPDNLITMCDHCHHAIHPRMKKPPTPWADFIR